MKGQVNQIFIYLVAILVIGVIALVGVRSISSLLDDKCTVDLVRFEDRIVESINLNNDYGAVNIDEFNAPCSYFTMCLIDVNQLGENGLILPADLDANQQALISDSVADGVTTNIFLLDDEAVQPSGYSTALTLREPTQALCFDSVQGRFSLKLTGEGRTTLVELS